MADELKTRTVVSCALNGTVDLEKPVVVKLGLFDERVVGVCAWSSRDGHFVLTLDKTDFIDQQTSKDDDLRRRKNRNKWLPWRYSDGRTLG